MHTRIDETVAQVVQAAHAGNLYVNRNIIGAVVGVQPFGGEGLSGTGPKAGGPLYLLRLLAAGRRMPRGAPCQAAGAPGEPPLRGGAPGAGWRPRPQPRQRATHCASWAAARGDARLLQAIEQLDAQAPDRRLAHAARADRRSQPLRRAAARGGAVPGRRRCRGEADRLVQLAAVLAVGSRAVWPAEGASAVASDCRRGAKTRVAGAGLDAPAPCTSMPCCTMAHRERRAKVLRTLAQRPGPIVGVTALAPGDSAVPLERLVIERSLSINTAAAGGNASLMTIG